MYYFKSDSQIYATSDKTLYDNCISNWVGYEPATKEEFEAWEAEQNKLFGC